MMKMQQHLLDGNSVENAFCYDPYWNSPTSSNTVMKEIEGKNITNFDSIMNLEKKKKKLTINL